MPLALALMQSTDIVIRPTPLRQAPMPYQRSGLVIGESGGFQPLAKLGGAKESLEEKTER